MIEKYKVYWKSFKLDYHCCIEMALIDIISASIYSEDI